MRNARGARGVRGAGARGVRGASLFQPRPGELDVALELEAPPLGVLIQLVEEVVALHVTPLEGAVSRQVSSGTGTW